MDPGLLSPDLVAALVVAGSLAGGGTLAFVAARRARQARRRQIDELGEPRRTGALEPSDADDDDDAIEGRKPQVTQEVPGPGGQPVGKPAARQVPERGPAQVLPFPGPTSTTAMPVDKPRAEVDGALAGERRAQREANAFAPGLARTRSGWVARLGQIFAGKRTLDPGLVEEIEKVLLTADIGVRTTAKLLDELRASLSRKDLQDASAVWQFLRRRSSELLTFDAAPVDFGSAKPFVLLVIGVNGSGKTTTIGKLSAKLREEGRSVLLAAGDTFRAAAAEQLEVWGSRSGAPVVRGKEGADPSSVLFDAVKRARTEGIDVVIADTAGRLHTKADLMSELQKVRRVIGKAADGAPHETWLVLDSTSGQNAIAQAQIFTEAMQVTGIVLTKLDGTAKGGVILGIADTLRIPVRYIGVGERVEDLRAFDADEFVEALYDNPEADADGEISGPHGTNPSARLH